VYNAYKEKRKIRPKEKRKIPLNLPKKSLFFSLCSRFGREGFDAKVPAVLPRGKTKDAHCIEGCIGPRVWAGAKSLTTYRDLNPGHTGLR